MPPTKEEQKVIDEFDKLFPLSWFATENYTGGANELEFAEWTERQTRLAKNRRESFFYFLLTALRNKEKEVWKMAEEILQEDLSHYLNVAMLSPSDGAIRSHAKIDAIRKLIGDIKDKQV